MSNTIIIYILLSFILFFLCSKVSYQLNLIDLPNKRKNHSIPTAYTGGIAISGILLIALQTFELFNVSDRELNLILSMAFLIALIGLVDDKFNLNAGGKISLQIFPTFYLIIFGNLALNQIGDYNYFLLELGAFKIPFTLLSVLFLTNAFNYFDGLDGTLSFTSISTLVILYFLTPDENFKLFLITIIIPISIFLFFNFSILKLPKLFLGDSGSLLLGFIFSFLLIYLANKNFVHPILLAWSVAIFVYEFISINLIRLMNKKNPFKPGLDHLHHKLFKKTKSIFLVNFFIFSANIIFFIIGYFSFSLINPLSSLFFYIFFCIMFFISRMHFQKR